MIKLPTGQLINKNQLQLISFGVAAIILIFLFIVAKPVDPILHNALISDLRELQKRDTELGEAVLHNHYQLHHNYDGLVALMKRIETLASGLSWHQVVGLLPNTPEVTDELNILDHQIKQKADALEDFKSHDALTKNSLLYLPRLIKAIESQISSEQHPPFDALIQDILQTTLDQGEQSRESLKYHIEVIINFIPFLPDEVKESTILAAKHATSILEKKHEITGLLKRLNSQDNTGLGTQLEQTYLQAYHKQQNTASVYRLLLLVAAMLMLTYAIFFYYRLIKQEDQLRVTATAFETHEGIMITDAKVNIIRVNKAFERITGYSAEESIGKNPKFLSSGKHPPEFYVSMWNSIKKTGVWQGEVWDKRKNGEIFPKWLSITATRDINGNITNYVGTQTDITDRKAAEAEIERLAFYDTLTQLPNRRMLIYQLGKALSASSRSKNFGSLLFMDLDNFKSLNDTLGHAIGDMLLQQVAERLKSCLRECDSLIRLEEYDGVARLGGDEFVVLLDNLSKNNIEAASKTKLIGEKILARLNQPYTLANHVYHCSASIGATLFIGDKLPKEELMKQADIAMYQAKKDGRNSLNFFDPIMQQTISNRVSLEKALRQAIEQSQFYLYYQIQVNNSHQPIGAEALIRWEHPQIGLISPDEFIALAEETGLILPVGKWIINTACAQLKDWQQNAHTRDLTLSVNVSAKQFHQTEFVAQVRTAVQQHGILPGTLKLELTESMLLKNIDDTISTMNSLRDIGIQLSLDDFGTGYSSLQYLKRLPLDQLKIDQSFICDITSNNSDKAIVDTIITMAKNLNMDTIAEGVETKEQQLLLFESGCYNYQGYFFGKPLPIDQFDEYLLQVSSKNSVGEEQNCHPSFKITERR